MGFGAVEVSMPWPAAGMKPKKKLSPGKMKLVLDILKDIMI
jgi:hypothetical protein